jgi:hypothetical protein
MINMDSGAFIDFLSYFLMIAEPRLLGVPPRCRDLMQVSGTRSIRKAAEYPEESMQSQYIGHCKPTHGPSGSEWSLACRTRVVVAWYLNCCEFAGFLLALSINSAVLAYYFKIPPLQ